MKTNFQMILKLKTLIILMIFCYSTHSYSQSEDWVAPAKIANRPSPYVNDVTAIKKGKKIYEKLCTTCHGNLGKGDGPTAKTLDPKPADHTSEGVQNQGDGAIYWKLSTGRGVMPAFQELLSKTERWQLVAYIKTLDETN